MLREQPPMEAVVVSKEKKKETKNPPLLYNLAELQNDCSRFFKISPDETLAVVQESTRKAGNLPENRRESAVHRGGQGDPKSISGLTGIPGVRPFAEEILEKESYKNIAKTRYVNDKQITDHYAIIPTGRGSAH